MSNPKMNLILEGLHRDNINESSVDDLVKELNSLPVNKGKKGLNSSQILANVDKYREVLDKFPVGTVLTHMIDAGEESFEKLNSRSWNHTRAPWKDTVQKNSTFDLGQWLFIRGNITRGPIKLKK